MKKILYILGLTAGIIALLYGAYILFNIYFVVSSHNGVTYDGFGDPYVNRSPSSPNTWIGYVCALGGGALSYHCYDNLKDEKE